MDETFFLHQNSQPSNSGVPQWCNQYTASQNMMQRIWKWLDIYDNHCTRDGRDRILSAGTDFGILSHIHLSHQILGKVSNFTIVGS
jgi:hypothetical protein